MKYKITILLLITFATPNFAQKKKILIVSTNRDSVGTNASGTFLKEMAYPFQYFTNRGFVVDIVTPKGGKAAIYHWGNMPDDLATIQKSELFVAKTQTTLAPHDVNPLAYGAVFYPGGHGQYFDVISDERIAEITREIYEQGGVVGTAGHGAASLIDVKLSNGKFLVDGKRMTCFPHWAELAFMNISNYGKLIAFDMEEVLGRRGGKMVICTRETRSNPDLTLVADVDNRLVTGAFASSAQWVAEQMVTIIENQQRPLQTEKEKILTAAKQYVEGRNTGDLERLKSAFHATATLKGVDPKTNEPISTPVADYIAKHTAGQKHECKTTMELMNHVNTIAVVHVTLTYPTYAYDDYLILMKVKDQWTITEKIYTKTTN